MAGAGGGSIGGGAIAVLVVLGIVGVAAVRLFGRNR
ncbi:MAG: hypothetical protein JWR01_1026 [Subtercola sp.]|nr:hypothetical protein [Subtercola sp.]